MDAERQQGLATWLAVFVATEAQPEMLADWVERTDSAIRSAIPELGCDERLSTTLRAAVEKHWLAFLQNLAHPDFDFRFVEAGRTLAAEIASAGLPLEVVIKVYRVAQQDVWAYGTEAIKRIPDGTCSQSDALIYFWDRAGAWLQASIEMSTDVYNAVKSKQMASPADRLLSVVNEVLAGDMHDPRRISTQLGGYPIALPQTALLLAGAQPDASAGERLARQAAVVLGLSSPVVVHPGAGVSWVWLPGSCDRRRLIELDDALRGLDMSMAVGATGEGREGFVTSHADAAMVHEIAGRGGHDANVPRVRFYEDIELTALVGCSPRVDRFVQRVLGNMAQDDDTMVRLRETLFAFLTHGRNVEEAAASLCVHRNTVRYRLGQAEDVLGTSIAKYGADLEVALRHLRAYHPIG